MSLSDTAKEAIRLASTAGIGKDVIDLLTQKVTLLDEKLLESNLSLEKARLKIGELLAENKKLRKQIAPDEDDRIHPKQEEILEVLHKSETLSVEQISQVIGVSPPDTKYHLDKLDVLEFVELDINRSVNDARAQRISLPALSRDGGRGRKRSLGFYYIGSKGREYVVTRMG